MKVEYVGAECGKPLTQHGQAAAQAQAVGSAQHAVSAFVRARELEVSQQRGSIIICCTNQTKYAISQTNRQQPTDKSRSRGSSCTALTCCAAQR